MPTRVQIRNFVRAETLVEESMFSDADLNTILDEGVRDVSIRFNWPFLAKSGTIPLVAGTQAYNFPADFARLEAAIVDGTNVRLQEISPAKYWQAYGDEIVSGEPRFFFIWGNQIHVHPVPTAAVDLNLFYYRQPTLMDDDGDSPEWASEFHMLLADYAAQNLWREEEDYNKSEAHEARYLQGIERMARYYLGRAIDSPFVIGSPSSTKRAHDGWRFPFFP